MSYTKEEKQEPLDEQNQIINETGLSVIDMEKERMCQAMFFYVWLVVLGLLITGVCFFVHGVDAKLCVVSPDWEMCINAHAEEGNTYCIIGEKLLASDGVDGFDVPHPPFEPPGRCFVYIKQPSFPNPHKSLWMEYRHSHGLWRVWNLTCFYVPYFEDVTYVTLDWNISQAVSSGYLNVILWNNGYAADMKTTGSYVFYSPSYQMTHMKIYCNNLFTH